MIIFLHFIGLVAELVYGGGKGLLVGLAPVVLYPDGLILKGYLDVYKRQSLE